MIFTINQGNYSDKKKTKKWNAFLKRSDDILLVAMGNYVACFDKPNMTEIDKTILEIEVKQKKAIWGE